MKKKDKQDIWSKNINELEKMLADQQSEYKKAVLTIGEEKNKNKAKNIKRVIARIKTAINEKKFVERVRQEKGGKNG